MMKQGHYASASVPAALFAGALAVSHVHLPVIMPKAVPLLVMVLCVLLVIWCSTWNDLDHPRFNGKMHPGAWLVRKTGQLFYRIRTDKDKVRGDVHRGPSHCVEWCILVGGLTTALTSYIPPLAPWMWLWGISVFLGTFSHVLADMMTPSGVPLSAVYNYFVHGEVWKRHSLNWFSTNTGAEHFGAVPALYLLTSLLILGMLGLLGPIIGWLLGVTL